MAQVAAAGAAVNPVVADVAVITKMIRVMLLAPLLLALPACTGGRDGRANGRRFAVPWFVPAFLVMVVVNSWFPPPAAHLPGSTDAGYAAAYHGNVLTGIDDALAGSAGGGCQTAAVSGHIGRMADDRRRRVIVCWVLAV